MAGDKGDKVGSERGVALIAAVMAVAVLMAIGLSFAFNMRLEEKAAANYMWSMKAKYVAEAGIDGAIAEWEKLLSLNPGHKAAARCIKKAENKLEAMRKRELSPPPRRSSTR